MELELKSKIAIVTGATSGIGRATAIRFAKAGASVAIVGRNTKALKDVAGEIRKLGREALPVTADITDPSKARRIVAQTSGSLADSMSSSTQQVT